MTHVIRDRPEGAAFMEKVLCLIAIVIAGLLTLAFLLDAAAGIPFGRSSIVLDVLFILGGGFIIWQGLETYREFS